MRHWSITVAALFIGSVNGRVAENSPAYESIEAVYGAHDMKSRVLSRDALRASHIARSGMATDAEWVSVRTPENCVFPIALHLLIDTSSNMMGETEQAVLDSFPTIDRFLQSHPGSSQSISFFRDKPVDGLGEAGDYCVKTAVVDGDAESVAAAYEQESSAGGGDWLNNHFGALVQIMKSPITVPWLKDSSKTHMVLMITNSAPHFAGDGGQSFYTGLENYTSFREDAMNRVCNETYYPTPKDVKVALRNANTYLGVTVLDSDSKERWAYQTFDWLNTYLHQPTDMLAEQSVTGTLQTQLGRILTGLERAECGDIVRSQKTGETLKQAPAGDILPQRLSRAGGLRASGGSDTTETPMQSTTAEQCSQPPEATCRSCIIDGGCCKDNKSIAPPLLIALKNRPKEIHIEARTLFRAEADLGHGPFLLELDQSSSGVEIN